MVGFKCLIAGTLSQNLFYPETQVLGVNLGHILVYIVYMELSKAT